jgi:ribosomal protein S12 methylthiotransferase
LKIYFDTLGCFKNQEDSERAAGLLEAVGHSITEDAAAADVLIVNTCGFIEDAKRESLARIFELADEKDDRKLIVTGCLTQRYSGELFGELPEADAILGVNDYGRLPEIIEKLCNNKLDSATSRRMTGDVDSATSRRMTGDLDSATSRRMTGDLECHPACSEAESQDPSCNHDRFLYVDGVEGVLNGPRHLFLPGSATAYLKVAEGCDNRCAYCAIPAIRGGYRSVPEDLLFDEAVRLAAGGARELVLIAQDVSAYGIDLYHEYTLPRLLKRLCLTDGVEWIRLMYCYEERITDELIDVMAAEPKICKYIDIPLQHASDDVLKRMGRRSTRAHIEVTIAKLRSRVPDIAVRTTLMTGFPGETEADFEELMEFAAAQRFERLGVFAFSPEDGTRAADMDDQILQDVAEARRDALMMQQMDISLERNRALVGRRLRVLVVDSDDDAKEGVYTGRTEYDAPEIDEEVIFSSEEPLDVGTFATILITDAMDYDLVGRR